MVYMRPCARPTTPACRHGEGDQHQRERAGEDRPERDALVINGEKAEHAVAVIEHELPDMYGRPWDKIMPRALQAGYDRANGEEDIFWFD